ncbi:urokinase plasminogen activator surface receptor-like [Scyliorhinus canicula]|uniref:urokinase plasminogen activator surface receptor-like n=1 Tax=Scyliorhinus canicula TaxID=7830 RepID=UPI0018F6CCF1|nr:urokinase plasminogen activator surface receptor-like [Scyliorhinus canicula]
MKLFPGICIICALVIAGLPQKVLTKLCQPCTANQSMINSTLYLSTSKECCLIDFCEKTVTGMGNGLMCYRCTPDFSSSSKNSTRMVECVGQQNSCFHSSSISNGTIKGCASENLCKNQSQLENYSFELMGDFYCCKGNGCNRGNSKNSATQSNNALLSFLVLSLVALTLCLY